MSKGQASENTRQAAKRRRKWQSRTHRHVGFVASLLVHQSNLLNVFNYLARDVVQPRRTAKRFSDICKRKVKSHPASFYEKIINFVPHVTSLLCNTCCHLWISLIKPPVQWFKEFSHMYPGQCTENQVQTLSGVALTRDCACQTCSHVLDIVSLV